MTQELAKTLTTALVQFINKERPKDSLCCSSYECEKIEKAFKDGTYDVVENLINRKLSGLPTEFEQELAWIICEWGSITETNISYFVQKYAPKLLSLAKKELLSYADESNPAIEAMADLERAYFCNPEKLPKWLKDDIARKELNAHTKGYNRGYKDAEKEYQKSVAYHYPEPVQPGVVYKAPNNWDDVIVASNTNSGTSTLKAEG